MHSAHIIDSGVCLILPCLQYRQAACNWTCPVLDALLPASLLNKSGLLLQYDHVRAHSRKPSQAAGLSASETATPTCSGSHLRTSLAAHALSSVSSSVSMQSPAHPASPLCSPFSRNGLMANAGEGQLGDIFSPRSPGAGPLASASPDLEEVTSSMRALHTPPEEQAAALRSQDFQQSPQSPLRVMDPSSLQHSHRHRHSWSPQHRSQRFSSSPKISRLAQTSEVQSWSGPLSMGQLAARDSNSASVQQTHVQSWEGPGPCHQQSR